MRIPGQKLQIIGILVVLYLLWGSTYPANTILLESLPPLLMTGARFVIASAVLGIFLLVTWRPSMKLTRQQLLAATAPAVVLIGGGSSLLVLGQQYVAPGLAGFMLCLTPVWAVGLGAITKGRPSLMSLAALTLGLVGLFLLLGSGGFTGEVIGVVILLVATFVWTVGSHLSQVLDMPKSLMVSLAWQMLVGGTIVMLAGLVAGESVRFDLSVATARSWTAWVYLVVFCTAIGYSAYSWLLKHATLSLALSYSFVSPVVALAISGVLFGEVFSPLQWLGGVLSLAAVVIVIFAETSSPTAKAPTVA